MTTYTFVKPTPTEYLPLEGVFKTSSASKIDYKITNEDVRLTVDSWYFATKDLEQFIDFLTSIKNHLESN